MEMIFLGDLNGPFIITCFTNQIYSANVRPIRLFFNGLLYYIYFTYIIVSSLSFLYLPFPSCRFLWTLLARNQSHTISILSCNQYFDFSWKCVLCIFNESFVRQNILLLILKCTLLCQNSVSIHFSPNEKERKKKRKKIMNSLYTRFSWKQPPSFSFFTLLYTVKLNRLFCWRITWMICIQEYIYIYT